MPWRKSNKIIATELFIYLIIKKTYNHIHKFPFSGGRENMGINDFILTDRSKNLIKVADF